MSTPTPPRPRVVTVLRGEALRKADERRRGTGWNTAAASPVPSPSGDARGGTTETVYGVPVTAVQSCCGRGCKHCRVYWHRMKSP